MAAKDYVPEIITVRVSFEEKETLQELAFKDDRTLANYVRSIIRTHLRSKTDDKW